MNSVSSTVPTAATAQEKTPRSAVERVSSVCSFVLLLGGVLIIALALYMVVVSYSPLPLWDGWMEVQIAAHGLNLLSPGWLWERDNEHRLVIPKLFLAADLGLFQGRQIFLLASIFAVQLLHLFLLSWSMRVLGGWRGALWRTGTGLAAFCLFYPSQYQNFTSGFQICFVLPQFLGTVSFVGLLLYWSRSQQHPEKRWSRFLVISIAAAVAATYSLANGMLLWPLLLLAAGYLHLRRSAILAYAVSAALSIGLYFYRLNLSSRWEQPANTVASRIPSPQVLLNFVEKYLAGRALLVGMLFLGALAIFLLVLFPALAYLRRRSAFGMQLILQILFWGGSILLIVVGRANQGIESRYHTVALLFFCSVCLLLLGYASSATGRLSSAFLPAQILLLVIVVVGATEAQRPIEEARRQGFLVNAAAASLVSGVVDAETLAKDFPFLDLLLWTARYLEVHHLSVFATPMASELGKPLQETFPVVSSAGCTGALENVVALDDPRGPGLRLTGWAWDVKRQRPASGIVVASNGTIQGVGAIGDRRPDVLPVGTANSHAGYIAYAPRPSGIAVVNVYALLDGSPRQACLVATQ